MAHVNATVTNCSEFCRIQLQLRKCTNPLKLFTAKEPLVSVGIYILGPLPKAKSERRFLLFITDGFKNMTQDVPTRIFDAYAVARAFAQECVFKFGSLETVLSDNGSKFASQFLRRVYQVMRI